MRLSFDIQYTLDSLSLDNPNILDSLDFFHAPKILCSKLYFLFLTFGEVSQIIWIFHQMLLSKML